MLSTAAMISLGKVYDGLMVEVRATNEKLRARAVKIVMQITGANPEQAEKVLTETRWEVKPAVLMIKAGVNRRVAGKLLEECAGSLREALEKLERRER